MALFTFLSVVLSIDGIDFNVVFNTLKKEQSDTLKEKYGSFETEWKERAESESKLGRMIERYQLLKADGQNKEALTLLDQIETLELQLGHRNIEKVSDMLNEMYQSRFLMAVSGDDKKRLQAYIDDNGINYHEVMKHIDTLVAEAKKPKPKG